MEVVIVWTMINQNYLELTQVIKIYI